jgi:NTP pyrophosphatase (non-canonical NTP hydrolase)
LHALSDDVEQISRRYAEAFGFGRDDSWFLLKLQEEVGELTQAYLAMTGQARAKDRSPDDLAAAFRAELADVLCHVLLLARHHDVDLEAEVTNKWLRYLDR